MTANELIEHFNRVYGIHTEWPKTYEVDADTYGHCCQAIFNDYIRKVDESNLPIEDKNEMALRVFITLGKSCGLMFKGVELILKS